MNSTKPMSNKWAISANIRLRMDEKTMEKKMPAEGISSTKCAGSISPCSNAAPPATAKNQYSTVMHFWV